MATTKKTRGRSTASRKTTPRARKMVYFFGGSRTEGKASQKMLLGGKVPTSPT